MEIGFGTMADSNIKDFRDLRVWQDAIEMAKTIYEMTRLFPKEEIYGITNQMRRSSVSVSSNIAEGQSRGHLREYVHFLDIARGSIAELESQVVLSSELGFLSEEQSRTVVEKIHSVRRQLTSLKTSLAKKMSASS